jgi:hypothetical protein
MISRARACVCAQGGVFDKAITGVYRNGSVDAVGDRHQAIELVGGDLPGASVKPFDGAIELE